MSVTHMQGIYCGKCKLMAEPLFALNTTIIILVIVLTKAAPALFINWSGEYFLK